MNEIINQLESKLAEIFGKVPNKQNILPVVDDTDTDNVTPLSAFSNKFGAQ